MRGFRGIVSSVFRRECAAITYSNMTACHIKLSSWADGLAASESNISHC